MHWYGRWYGGTVAVVVVVVVGNEEGCSQSQVRKARQHQRRACREKTSFCRGEDERLQMTAVVGATLR